MVKRRHDKNRNRVFVVASAQVELGSSITDDGHLGPPVARLELVGKWSHDGRTQTIPLLLAMDIVGPLADLLDRARPKSEPDATPAP